MVEQFMKKLMPNREQDSKIRITKRVPQPHTIRDSTH